MARIINVDNCLKAITHKENGKIAIKINDDMILANNRTILYSWDDDHTAIEDTQKYDIQLDIRELSMLVCNGYRGQINISKDMEKSLLQAFPTVDSACYEIF